MKVWSAADLVALQVREQTTGSRHELRVFDLHIGARGHEIRIVAAWTVFWPLRNVLTSKSLS